MKMKVALSSIISGLAIVLSTSVPTFADTTSSQSTNGNSVITTISIPATTTSSKGISPDSTVTGVRRESPRIYSWDESLLLFVAVNH